MNEQPDYLSDAMARALEQLAKGPAVKGARTGSRKIEYRTAARLISRDLATLNSGTGAFTITELGREQLEQHRAGWR